MRSSSKIALVSSIILEARKNTEILYHTIEYAALVEKRNSKILLPISCAVNVVNAIALTQDVIESMRNFQN